MIFGKGRDKNMKKILVLFTGGTIGSITTDGIIDVEREGKYAVVEATRVHTAMMWNLNVDRYLIYSAKTWGFRGGRK